jgi:hypothetical protein
MQAVKWPTLIAISVASIHFAVVSYFALIIDHNSLPWIWMIFALVDFPISLLTFAGLKAMLLAWGDVVWEEPWRQFLHASWPVFVHAILGSVWWGVVWYAVSRTTSTDDC